jgi:hypothetical protein
MEPSELPLRNFLMNQLYRRVGQPGTLSGSGSSMVFDLRAGGMCEVEGSLNYELPDKTLVAYESDILFSLDTGKKITVDLKFVSSLADQFKARAYTAMHMKGKYGDDLYCVMAYVHVSGVDLSTATAKSYCYPFDEFIGMELKKPDDLSNAIVEIAARLEKVIERMPVPQTAKSVAG